MRPTTIIAALCILATSSIAHADERYPSTYRYPMIHGERTGLAQEYRHHPPRYVGNAGCLRSRSHGRREYFTCFKRSEARHRRHPGGGEGLSTESTVAEILPHPYGCPRRAFCGCGAAVKVFGAPIRSLWLAANWFRFPPAAAAPGMVAVRRHHVFVIEHMVSPGIALAYDANSWSHMTLRHLRSLAGYSVRNPRG